MSCRASTAGRVRGGKRQIQDGPYAGTRVRLGGYFIIDVPSLEDALTEAFLKARIRWPADGIPT